MYKKGAGNDKQGKDAGNRTLCPHRNFSQAIIASFNYCPVVWYFSTFKQMQKIERIQERALRFILNDYNLDYDSLLVKSDNVTVEVKRMRSLCNEVFKTLNGLNPVYMKDTFN